MAHGDFKNLTRRTASDKVLRDKSFDITENLKYDKYQRGLASIVCKKSFLIKIYQLVVLKMRIFQTKS